MLGSSVLDTVEEYSLNIYLCVINTVAPVRQEILRNRWKKSTKAFESLGKSVVL